MAAQQPLITGNNRNPASAPATATTREGSQPKKPAAAASSAATSAGSGSRANAAIGVRPRRHPSGLIPVDRSSHGVGAEG